jgi:hypothetical protein
MVILFDVASKPFTFAGAFGTAGGVVWPDGFLLNFPANASTAPLLSGLVPLSLHVTHNSAAIAANTIAGEIDRFMFPP